MIVEKGSETPNGTAAAEVVNNEASVAETSAAEPAATDSPATETPPVEPKKDPASAKFAALARREKEAQAASQRVKQAEADLARRQQEIDARFKEIEERDRKARDPSLSPAARALAIGVTPEEINRDLLGGWKPPEKDPLAEKLTPVQEQLAKLAKENEELRKKVDEVDSSARERKQREDYLKFVDAVKNTVNEGGDKYEYLNLNGQEGIDLVQQTMLEYYQKNNNTLLSYDEACDLVEEWYESQAEKYTKAKKMQAKFSSASQATPTVKASPKADESPKTLTAEMTSGTQVTEDISKMSDREAKAYIAKMIKFKE